MKTYLIERRIPNAEKFSNEDLQDIAKRSNSVIRSMGGIIEWDHSYVVKDKLFCVYRATSEAVLREHGIKGDFPVDGVYEIAAIFSPESEKGIVQRLNEYQGVE